MGREAKVFSDLTKFNTPDRVSRVESFYSVVHISSSDAGPHMVVEFSEAVVCPLSFFNQLESVFALYEDDEDVTFRKLSMACTRSMRTLLLYGTILFEDEAEEADLFVSDDEMLARHEKIFQILEKSLC